MTFANHETLGLSNTFGGPEPYDVDRGTELAMQSLGSLGLLPSLSLVRRLRDIEGQIRYQLCELSVALQKDFDGLNSQVLPMVVPQISRKLPFFGQDGLVDRFDTQKSGYQSYATTANSQKLAHLSAGELNSQMRRAPLGTVAADKIKRVGYQATALVVGGKNTGLVYRGKSLHEQRALVRQAQSEHALRTQARTVLGVASLPAYIMTQTMARESNSEFLDQNSTKTSFVQYRGTANSNGNYEVPVAHFNFPGLLLSVKDESADPDVGVRLTVSKVRTNPYFE